MKYGLLRASRAINFFLSLAMNQFEHFKRRIRLLTKSLIISGAVNLGLLFVCLFLLFQDKIFLPSFEHKPFEESRQIAPLVDARGKAEVLRLFSGMGFDQLLGKLTNKSLVEDGYMQRDLALACLVAYYHFNIHQALSGMALQDRKFIMEKTTEGRPSEIHLFPGLTDEHFQAIIRYANTEKWPLTSKGLFLLLKYAKNNSEASMKEAFFRTAEFQDIEMLFNRTSLLASRELILQLLEEGDWQIVNEFSQSQRAAQDLSVGRLQSFLLEYVKRSSKVAAQLLFSIDKSFVAKKLDDQHLFIMMQLLTETKRDTVHLCQDILVSPRSDAVIQLAARRLYEFVGEPMPDPYDHLAALNRFVPGYPWKEKSELIGMAASPLSLIKNSREALPPFAQGSVEGMINSKRVEKDLGRKEAKPPSLRQAKPSVHLVTEGDTLWQIAKRYNVDLERLKRHNQLQSSQIHPGALLKIP